MSKGLQLKWETFRPMPDGSTGASVTVLGHNLEAVQTSRAPNIRFRFRVVIKGGGDLNGTAPTQLLAQEGAEDALRRYLGTNGEDIMLTKYQALMDEWMLVKAFVKGEVIG